MHDREETIKGLEKLRRDLGYGLPDRSNVVVGYLDSLTDAISMLKEQDNWFGMHQTADGITFISSGTAKHGEERGFLLGKELMFERLEKELLYRGLLTDDIRSAFETVGKMRLEVKTDE